MSITLNFFGTALGIQSDIGIYRWNGHSFNPTGTVGAVGQTWNPWVDAWTGFALYNPTSSFDLTGFQFGNEVVCAGLKFTSTVADHGTATITFKDPTGLVKLTYSYSWTTPGANYWVGMWSGFGVKADDLEIWCNGTYTAEYMITYTGGYINGSVAFTITNYPTATHAPTKIGSIWVEGERLCFICQDGYKIQCRHTAGGTYVGTQYAGSVWLETDGKITYIDETGYKRTTKLGDRYGWLGLSSEIPSSPGVSKHGHLWVSNDFNDTYICFVSSNGVKYRVGAGYVGAGDYQ